MLQNQVLKIITNFDILNSGDVTKGGQFLIIRVIMNWIMPIILYPSSPRFGLTIAWLSVYAMVEILHKNTIRRVVVQIKN
jgi:hypothetical protein